MSRRPRLHVERVEFAGAVAEPGGRPPADLPQIAVAGRSNVGKSSLLNRLVGRKKLARTSKAPGRTREIHFYRVNDRFLLVDLPGYGFARVPAEVRQRWGPLIETYLAGNPLLLGLVLLIDARRGPTDDDADMMDYLVRLGVPALFVLTKVDKLSRGERGEAVERTLEGLEIPRDQLVVTSARTGEGVDTLRDSLAALLEAWETR